MEESNAPKKQKDPADVVCPSLWRAKKAARGLVNSGDPNVDVQKFKSLEESLNSLGVVCGCRFARASGPRDESTGQAP